MSDPISQTPPASTPPPNDLPNPQDMVDKVLGVGNKEELPLAFVAPSVTPPNTAGPATAPPLTPPLAGSPEPTPIPEPSAPIPAPEPVVLPSAKEEPQAETPVSVPPPASAPPAEVPPATIPTPIVAQKKKSKLGLVMGGILLLLATVSVGGLYYYQQFAQPGSIFYITKWIRDSSGNVIKNPAYDPTNVVNEQQRDADLGINQDTTISNLGKGACTPANNGTWCESVDSNGRAYAFCIDNRIAKGCNQYAAEKGFTISYEVNCLKSGDNWVSDLTTGVNQVTQDVKTNADTKCNDANGNFGTGAWLCKDGVKGYNGGPCTELNGVAISAIPKCFCGTIQKDTGTGHTSYTSTCGCGTTDTPNLITDTPATMSCTGITKTPATTPVIGDKLTFTCAGVVTPPTAGTLSYKFRYSINDGAVVALTNKTATTADLTIAACGTYKVQCQACATLAGVLTCDPTWTGATQ